MDAKHSLLSTAGQHLGCCGGWCCDVTLPSSDHDQEHLLASSMPAHSGLLRFSGVLGTTGSGRGAEQLPHACSSERAVWLQVLGFPDGAAPQSEVGQQWAAGAPSLCCSAQHPPPGKPWWCLPATASLNRQLSHSHQAVRAVARHCQRSGRGGRPVEQHKFQGRYVR